MLSRLIAEICQEIKRKSSIRELEQTATFLGFCESSETWEDVAENSTGATRKIYSALADRAYFLRDFWSQMSANATAERLEKLHKSLCRKPLEKC